MVRENEARLMAEPESAASSDGARAARQHAHAAAGPAARGQLLEACKHYEEAIRLQPDNAQLHYQIGVCQWRLGQAQAGASLQQAVHLNPAFTVAHAALAAWALQAGMIERAEQASYRALELAPEDNTVLQTRASVLEARGELEAAWLLALKLVQRGFLSMPLLRLYGRMAPYQGQAPQALELIEKQLLDPARSQEDLARLHFTAAELLDHLGRYDDAFAHARRGNELVRPAYDPASHERTIDGFIAYFTRERLRTLARASSLSEKPVFVVGMPRSGTSLVEQILASHPAVHGAGELETMSRVWETAVQRLAPAPYPACLDRLTAEQADALAQLYLQPLTALAPAATRITDKLPLNFLHLGLIALLLPGARIIDCRRDPRDSCLSCYLTLFQTGNDFKYNLQHTAHFYCLYRRLMRHWQEALDLPILEVSYERLVTEPETQTRRMLDFLGLPWDERCLRFHETKRPVTTASMQQVRRPLYQSSIGRWRHYERHLVELNRWFE
jgi:tetratricopeptide (TPR) repeat protein